MPPKLSSNQLPPKEHNSFKNVVRFYETKQLKKALKAADTILKKFPEHGETLAMKGLTLNALDKKEEATELVRKGLRMDMRSHICWHVYGLLYRSERDYREAAKAYLNALRIDKDNQQILRDLALLQIQIRDYDGLEDTRRRLLTVRPNQRNSWIGFALSYHLLKNYSTAISVLDTYQETLKQSNEQEDRYEVSELSLYKNFILEESGDFSSALSHLEDSSSKIVDRLAFRETRARLLSALGKHEDAANEYRKLLSINPDNHIYVRGLQSAMIRKEEPDRTVNGIVLPTKLTQPSLEFNLEKQHGMRKLAKLQAQILGPVPTLQSEEDISIALEICNELTKEYPFSRTAARVAIDIIPDGNHPEFLSRMDAYLRPGLRRGVPSLFSDIKPLYSNPSKTNAIGKLVESFRTDLADPEKGKLPQLTPVPDGAGSMDIGSFGKEDISTEEPSCTLLWVHHFLAQHYDRLGDRDKALEAIDAAISHTPSTVESYLAKARILKHCGDLEGAVKVADQARNMDLADRYLNTKCSKYGLLADKITDAETWIGLFTRDGDSGGLQALYDMQCMWFELAAAESHLRRNELPQALKKFTAVERHFADMVEDQFDFHSYCLRKVTLRSYVNLLRFEDSIRGHPYYARAATGLVRCLLHLNDMPEDKRALIVGEHADIKGYATMSDAERKKAVSKRKKQLARKRQNQHASHTGKNHAKAVANGVDKNAAIGNEKAANTSNENKPKNNPGWMETDANGMDYIKELFKRSSSKEDPLLREATKIVRELRKNLSDQLETHVLSFEVAIRKQKYLQALQAVKRAQSIQPEDPQTVLLSVKFEYFLSMNKMREMFSSPLKDVFEAEGDILKGKSIMEYITDFCDRNQENAQRRVGGAAVRLWMASAKIFGAGTVDEACRDLAKAIGQSDARGIGENVLPAMFCRTLLDDLANQNLNPNLITEISSSCKKLYPKSSCF